MDSRRRREAGPAAVPARASGRQQIAPCVVEVCGDDTRRGVGVSAAQRLIEGDMLSVVTGDPLGGQNLVLHLAPLGVPAYVIDVLVDRHHQRVVRRVGEQLVELTVPLGEIVGVDARLVEPRERVAHAVDVLGGALIAASRIM